MDSSRTNKYIKNLIGSLFLQIVTIFTGFISPIWMLHAFGSEVNGITLSILQFISYISLVEAGLGNAALFALYKPLAEKDHERRDAVISATRISYNRVGIIFILLSIILAAGYPLIGKTDVLSAWELSSLVLALSLSGVFNFFILSKYRTVLNADQCGYWVSFASAMQLLANLAIIIITINLGCGVIIVRGCAIASFFIPTIILSIVVRHKYKGIRFNADPDFKALEKRKDAMTIQLLGIVTISSPIIILTAMSDFKELSVYAVYGMITASLTTILEIFTSGLSSSFGNIYAKEKEENTLRLASEFMTGFYYVTTIIYSIAVITIVQFVDVYTTGINDANYHLPLFGFLIVFNGLVSHLYSPHGLFIQSFGKFKEVKSCFIIQAIIAVSMTAILTHFYSLDGAMCAMIISHLFTAIYFLIFTRKKIIRLSMAHNVRLMILMILIFISTYLIWNCNSSPITTYFQWFKHASIVSISIIAITTILFFISDKKNMTSLLKRLLPNP